MMIEIIAIVGFSISTCALLVVNHLNRTEWDEHKKGRLEKILSLHRRICSLNNTLGSPNISVAQIVRGRETFKEWNGDYPTRLLVDMNLFAELMKERRFVDSLERGAKKMWLLSMEIQVKRSHVGWGLE